MVFRKGYEKRSDCAIETAQWTILIEGLEALWRMRCGGEIEKWKLLTFALRETIFCANLKSYRITIEWFIFVLRLLEWKLKVFIYCMNGVRLFLGLRSLSSLLLRFPTVHIDLTGNVRYFSDRIKKNPCWASKSVKFRFPKVSLPRRFFRRHLSTGLVRQHLCEKWIFLCAEKKHGACFMSSHCDADAQAPDWPQSKVKMRWQGDNSINNVWHFWHQAN